MGSPATEPNRLEDREAQVDVTLTKGFWMMRTEMTQELYETLGLKNDSKFKGPKLPVETVSYAEAVACAQLLTRKLREAGALPEGWEIRLPTEAQWEYAARAGTTAATPFGDSLSSTQANFDGNHPYGGRGAGFLCPEDHRGRQLRAERLGPGRYGWKCLGVGHRTLTR